MKSFNKITNPEKFKIFISLFIIFSCMNNSKAFGSEKKSTLHKGISRDNQFDAINPGIVLNDLIIQHLIINSKSFFDFLKGTERYKYVLGSFLPIL